MASENKGNQNLTFDYKQALRAQTFNRLFYKIIQPGIYNGGRLSKTDNSTVSLSTLTAYFEDASYGIGARVETTEAVSITVSPSIPYIILRYNWVNVANNYMDVLAVAWGDVLSTDLIVGRALWSGSTLSETFDYTKRTKGELSEGEVQETSSPVPSTTNDPFYVQATEPASNKVSIKGGNIITATGEVVFQDDQESPSFSSTTLGRVDLLYIDSSGAFQVLEGTDASSPTAPTLGGDEGAYVLCTITRGASASVITGNQIQNYGMKAVRFNNINASTLEGKAQGHNSGDIPIDDGVLNTDLNAQYLSGAELSTDVNFVDNSDSNVPTQKASKAFILSNAVKNLLELKDFYLFTSKLVTPLFSKYELPDHSDVDFQDASLLHQVWRNYQSGGTDKIYITYKENGIAINDTYTTISLSDLYSSRIAITDTHMLISTTTALKVYQKTAATTWGNIVTIESKIIYYFDISDNYLAYWDHDSDNIHILKLSGANTWGDEYVITPDSDVEVRSLAFLDGEDYLAISAYDTDEGFVQFFQNTADNTWDSAATLTSSTPHSSQKYFGYDFSGRVGIDIRGDWAAIYQHYTEIGSLTSVGSLHIYEKTAPNTWSLYAVKYGFQADDADYFGAYPCFVSEHFLTCNDAVFYYNEDESEWERIMTVDTNNVIAAYTDDFIITGTRTIPAYVRGNFFEWIEGDE